MKKRILLTLLLYSISQTYAFTQNCINTTIEDIAFLRKEFNGTVADKNMKTYWHVIRTGQGGLNNDLNFFTEIIEDTKSIFSTYSITLGGCPTVNYIDSDLLYNVDNVRDICLFDEFCEEDGLNVFLIENGLNIGASSLRGNKCFVSLTTIEESVPVICHEIGHVFGLFHLHGGRIMNMGTSTNGSNHDWRCNKQGTNFNGSTGFFTNCDGGSFNVNFPLEMADGSNGAISGDYVVDTPPDILWDFNLCDDNPFVDCMATDDSCGNLLDDDKRKDPDCNMLSPDWFNFMRNIIPFGASKCLNHFTPGQVSRMHGVIEKYHEYMYVNPLGIFINEDKTINTSGEHNSLWISDDVTLTIKDVTINMGEDTNINLGKRARLILDNAKLTTCSDSWIGITCNDEALSVEMINGSTIEKAEIGIKLKPLPFTSGQTIDDQDNHATLRMYDNCTIQHCDIGIQFGIGKTESTIEFGSYIKNNRIGIMYQNHSGLVINSSDLSYNVEAINSIDGYMNIRLFTRIHNNEIGVRVEGTLPLASGIQIGDNGTIPNWFFSNSGADIISNGSEHPAKVNVNNCSFTNTGETAFLCFGANSFNFTNNNVKNAERGAVIFGSGSNQNDLKCNKFENITEISNTIWLNNKNTNILQNHFNGQQNLNIGFVAASVPTQGTEDNPAANCLSDGNQSAHIQNIGFLSIGPISFEYIYYDDSHSNEDCQIPKDPLNYVATESDTEGDGYCDEIIGVFNLITPGGGGSATGINPQLDELDDACLHCISNIIEEWIGIIVNGGGDDPTTISEEGSNTDNPAMSFNEAILDQWINYGLYVAMNTGNEEFGVEILAPLKQWEWQARLYALYIHFGNLDEAEQVLNSLSEDNENQEQFKQLQYINLKRYRGEHITGADIDIVLDIANGLHPSSGFARSLHYLVTGIHLSFSYPEFPDRGDTRSQDENKVTQIYPNPGSDIIEINSASIIDKVDIIDITGNSVYTNSPNSNHLSVNIENIGKGIYIVYLKYENGLSETKKIIKI